MNHIRFTASDIPRAECFYDPLLRFMGYELVERDERRLVWRAPWPAGNLQAIVPSFAAQSSRHRRHDRYSPGLHPFAFNTESREEMDRFYDLLAKRDVEILGSPAAYDYQPGYCAVYFIDPNDLKLELVHVPDCPWEAPV
jgi:catechol 2,3-dioxygenase-like lactoylglutathione lyase family enzyme